MPKPEKGLAMAKIKRKYRLKRRFFDSLQAFNQYLSTKFDLPPLMTGEAEPSSFATANEALLSPKEAATRLGISVKTLANWRCTGTTGLKHVQIGNRVFYRPADLRAFVARSTKQSTSDRGTSI